MPQKLGDTRGVAHPRPQVVFQFFEGRGREPGLHRGDHGVRRR